MGFDTPGLRLRNLDRSIAFYTTVLGMRVTWRMNPRDGRWNCSPKVSPRLAAPRAELVPTPRPIPSISARGRARPPHVRGPGPPMRFCGPTAGPSGRHESIRRRDGPPCIPHGPGRGVDRAHVSPEVPEDRTPSRVGL